MRDRHGFSGFSRANLVCGAFDLQMTPSVRNWGARNLILNTEIVEWFIHQYVPSGGLADPDISPLYADLSDLPHALFSIGTLDPLLDDSLFMWTKWLAGGNRADMAIYPGGIHGFNAFPFPLAQRANDRIDAFLSD